MDLAQPSASRPRPLHVVNVMLSGGLGGVERSVLDYCEALRLRGHSATAVLRKGAEMQPLLKEAGIDTASLALPRRWNPFARRALASALKPADLVILHGNRAAQMTANLPHLPPVVAVAHSRFFKCMPHFSAVIALTEKNRQSLIGKISCPVYRVPHAVRGDFSYAPGPFRTPPVIGALGRLSPEKGFDLLLHALAGLRQKNIPFRAVIGGSGPESAMLETLSRTLGLSGCVEFPGWVEDTHSFYTSLDIFCLSSRAESFSITLANALAHALPSVATQTEGPMELIEDKVSGLLTPVGAAALEAALEALLADPTYAASLGLAAQESAKTRYAFPVFAERLEHAATVTLRGGAA